MERYESYKDSGVKWLGEIPGHWEMYKLKYLFKLNRLKNVGNKCNTILSLSYGKIIIKKDLNEGLSPESYESYQLLNGGDIVIRSTDLQNDHTSLRTGLVKNDGAITSAYIGLKNQNTNIYDSRYYHYFLHDWDITKAIYNEGKGLRQSLNWDDIKNMLLPVLDIQEQTAIANYLDSVTSKIDVAISQQQKMIDLLNERKQIIIQNAVTKGLDPNAKMKDSGVEWIGEIPEDWEVIQLRHTVYNKDYLRQPITADQRKRNNPKYAYFGASGIIDKIDNYNVDDKVLLIGEDGANLLLRNLPLIYKAEGKFWVNNHAHILKPRNGFNYDYLAYVMEAADYTLFITGSAQPKLSQSNLNAVKLPIPSFEKQSNICDWLSPRIEQIDSSISQCNKMISLLQERKQIIINDVVTGKVKVI